MAQEKLQTISLAGYRSYGNDIEKNKIDLHNINIIIGANGAGKSNLISFLEMVSFMMTRGLRNYVAKQGGTQTLLHFGAKHTEQLQGKLAVRDEGDEEYTYYFCLERAASDQLFFASERLYYQERRDKSRFKYDFGVGHNESGIADSYETESRPLRDYLARLKVFHFNDTSINSRIRSSANTTDEAYLRSDGGNIAAFLHRMRTNPDEVPYYERIKKYIRMVLPQFFDFVLDPDENRGVGPKLATSRKRGGIWPTSVFRWSFALCGAHHSAVTAAPDGSHDDHFG